MTDRLKGRLLIVDDDPDVLVSLTNLLQDEGLEVRACPDAFSALEFVESEQFDAVLSDIRMPAVSGLELLDHVQRHDPDMPVIMITGFAEFETAVSAIKRHAFDLLLKPFDPDMLLSVIARALNYRHLRTVEREYAGLLKSTVTKNTEELKQQIEELRQARDAAMESSRLKSEFMAIMSHEIRTPLHGMHGLLELLQLQEHSAGQARYYSMLQLSIDRLSSLINNVLDFSKMASGSFELSPRQFSLGGLLANLIDTYTTKAKARGLELSSVIGTDLPDMIVADDVRLRQIMSNLLDNAIKFTQQGNVCLTVRVEEKALSGNPGPISLFCSVSDTGIGIMQEKIGTIFEGFRQVDGSFTRRHEGAGLGLAIARQTVQSMGGSIWVESRPGSGSTFYFTVPIEPWRENETTDRRR
jgi:signal transduction histidine kinase